MSYNRRTSLIAGLVFLATFVFSIPQLGHLRIGKKITAVAMLATTLRSSTNVPTTFLLGPAFCAGLGNGILLGYLMYKSGLVPRRMAMIGLIGGPLALVTATAVLFGAWEQNSAIGFLFTLPEVVWEFSLSIYLIFWGFKAGSPILAQHDAAHRQRLQTEPLE